MYFSAIVWCVMENHGYNQVKDLSAFKFLAAHGATFAQYHAVTHPSGPNYRVMASGETWTRREVFDRAEPTVATELSGHGIGTYDWQVRGEADLKHDPYRDLHSPLEVLYGALDPDRLPPQTQVYLGFDDWNNAHNGTLDAVNRNLLSLIRTLDASKWFNTPVNGHYPVFMVTWDESFLGDQRVYTAFYGHGVKAGYVSKIPYTHYDFCRTLTDNWGLPPLGKAAQAKPISDIWK